MLTCRQYRLEALPIFVAVNRFVYLAPERKFDVGTKGNKLGLDIYYLQFVKDLTIVDMNHKELDLDLSVQMGAMLFLNQFLRRGTRLDKLCICSDRPEPEPLKQTGYDLRNAELYVPLALRLIEKGLVKQLLVGSYERYTGKHVAEDDTDDYTKAANQFRLTEQTITRVLDSYAAQENTKPGLNVFDAHQHYNAGSTCLNLVPSKEEDVFALQETWLMAVQGARVNRTRWYGRSLSIREIDLDVLDDPDRDSDYPEGSHEVTLLVAKYKGISRGGQHHWVTEVETWQDIDLTEQDYDDLIALQEWWELYLASLQPGQEKITGYFSKISKTAYLNSLPKTRPKRYRFSVHAARSELLRRQALDE